MTSWVLIFFTFSGHSGGFSTVENLQSHSECKRVYSVISKTFDKNISRHLCMEVINK